MFLGKKPLNAELLSSTAPRADNLFSYVCHTGATGSQTCLVAWGTSGMCSGTVFVLENNAQKDETDHREKCTWEPHQGLEPQGRNPVDTEVDGKTPAGFTGVSVARQTASLLGYVWVCRPRQMHSPGLFCLLSKHKPAQIQELCCHLRMALTSSYLRCRLYASLDLKVCTAP